jgi:hypothetical protein
LRCRCPDLLRRRPELLRRCPQLLRSAQLLRTFVRCSERMWLRRFLQPLPSSYRPVPPPAWSVRLPQKQWLLRTELLCGTGLLRSGPDLLCSAQLLRTQLLRTELLRVELLRQEASLLARQPVQEALVRQ